jgi:hypothetical protein
VWWVGVVVVVVVLDVVVGVGGWMRWVARCGMAGSRF